MAVESIRLGAGTKGMDRTSDNVKANNATTSDHDSSVGSDLCASPNCWRCGELILLNASASSLALSLSISHFVLVWFKNKEVMVWQKQRGCR